MNDLKEFLKVNKPSAILRECVSSIKLMENRGYKICMDLWITRDTHTNKVCTVCAAGAYAARRIGNLKCLRGTHDSDALAILIEFSGVPYSVMYALDILREGQHGKFKKYLGIPRKIKMTPSGRLNYKRDKHQFLTQFEAWAVELEQQEY